MKKVEKKIWPEWFDEEEARLEQCEQNTL